MSPNHSLRWVAAESFVTSPVAAAPSILRFASDDFMDRMLRTLADRPQDLPEFRARPESCHAPGPKAAPLPDPASARRSIAARTLERKKVLKGFERARAPALAKSVEPLKLFQPIHQRFYLATAHLVCELPGLPPRKTNTGDRTGFVIRRLFKNVEHGFVKGAAGRGVWVPIADAHHHLASGESLLPVFPMGYSPPNGPPRSLYGGLIPVAQHDAYVFAAIAEAPVDPKQEFSGSSTADELKALAMTKVIAPWQALLGTAASGVASVTAPATTADPPWEDKRVGGQLQDAHKPLNTQLVEGSWRVLQEIREWLQTVFPDQLEAPPASGKVRALFDLLGKVRWTPSEQQAVKPFLEASAYTPTFSGSLLEAVRAMTDQMSAALDANEQRWQPKPLNKGTWPNFAFPLALAFSQPPTAHSPLGAVPDPAVFGTAEQAYWEALMMHNDPKLVSLLMAIHEAIDEAEREGKLPSHHPQVTSAAALAKALAKKDEDPVGPARFVLRFVHLRCDCGPLSPAVISAPSEEFQLAGFFDPDAPLRPIRIALPFDTTPGGLRKYTKNSAFIVSDVLCGQMKRLRSLGFGDLVLSVLPWPFHKDLKFETDDGPCGGEDRFGMICSLSIPIITIVAFVLLIVIAALLDLIFHWLPFLLVCFPVRKLKAKP